MTGIRGSMTVCVIDTQSELHYYGFDYRLSYSAIKLYPHVSEETKLKISKLAFILLPTAALLLSIIVLYSAETRQQPEGLEAALIGVSLHSLKSEYDILVTGDTPAHGLVPRRDGMTRMYLTGEDRIAAALRVREAAAKYGRRYASVQVKLNPEGIETRGDKLILQANEETDEVFAYDDSAIKKSHMTQGKTKHNFIFSVVTLPHPHSDGSYTIVVGEFAYTLIEDITEPQMVQSRACAVGYSPSSSRLY